MKLLDKIIKENEDLKQEMKNYIRKDSLPSVDEINSIIYEYFDEYEEWEDDTVAKKRFNNIAYMLAKAIVKELK